MVANRNLLHNLLKVRFYCTNLLKVREVLKRVLGCFTLCSPQAQLNL